jgi:hypothetical protein
MLMARPATTAVARSIFMSSLKSVSSSCDYSAI